MVQVQGKKVVLGFDETEFRKPKNGQDGRVRRGKELVGGGGGRGGVRGGGDGEECDGNGLFGDMITL